MSERVWQGQKLPRDNGGTIFSARHWDGAHGPQGFLERDRFQTRPCWSNTLGCACALYTATSPLPNSIERGEGCEGVSSQKCSENPWGSCGSRNPWVTKFHGRLGCWFSEGRGCLEEGCLGFQAFSQTCPELRFSLGNEGKDDENLNSQTCLELPDVLLPDTRVVNSLQSSKTLRNRTPYWKQYGRVPWATDQRHTPAEWNLREILVKFSDSDTQTLENVARKISPKSDAKFHDIFGREKRRKMAAALTQSSMEDWVLIYLPVTSQPLISLQEDAFLSPCNFATTHLTACILNFHLPSTSRPMKRRTLSQCPSGRAFPGPRPCMHCFLPRACP